jgi:hypothetical protein
MKHANSVGGWAFIVGVIIALGLGILSAIGIPLNWLLGILVVAGLVVGFFNVGGDETHRYLVAAAVLVIVASLGSASLGAVPLLGAYLATTLQTLLLFVVPATVVVALKEIYAIAKDA